MAVEMRKRRGKREGNKPRVDVNPSVNFFVYRIENIGEILILD